MTCDAPLFRDRTVGVLGSEDLVVKEAIELYEYTQGVTIYTNGKDLDVSGILQKQLEKRNIPINKNRIKGIYGDEMFQGVKFDEGVKEMEGLIIAEGTSGSLDFARALGITIRDGRLVVDETQYTQVPRVYAAGDCTGKVRQIGAAVGEGAKAALNLIAELRGEKYVDWKH